MKPINANIKKQWLEALRSGKYEQARGELMKGQGLCCIGVGFVACVGVLEDHLDLDDDRTSEAASELGIDSEAESILVDLNDNKQLDFMAIADYIDHEIPVKE